MSKPIQNNIMNNSSNYVRPIESRKKHIENIWAACNKRQSVKNDDKPQNVYEIIWCGDSHEILFSYSFFRTHLPIYWQKIDEIHLRNYFFYGILCIVQIVMNTLRIFVAAFFVFIFAFRTISSSMFMSFQQKSTFTFQPLGIMAVVLLAATAVVSYYVFIIACQKFLVATYT